jgi:hypothetical protein
VLTDGCNPGKLEADVPCGFLYLFGKHYSLRFQSYLLMSS